MEGITILYPENEDGVELDLDIVALHGLNGSPQKTFTDPRTEKQWLRDFLPQDLKRTRVMIFGYVAKAALGDSVAGIRDHARTLLGELDRVKEGVARKRRLIFVGHSLGGLVIKQALVIASQEARYSHTLNCTLGVIFFGTPHQGSALANYGATLVRVFNAMAVKHNPELLNSLKSGGETLQNLTLAFRNLCEGRRWNIASFYEMKTMLALRNLIVEKESAVLAPPGTSLEYENQIPVNETHRNMCRFSSAENKTYKMFVKSLKDILRGGRGKEVQNVYFEVPDKMNQHFTGRYEIQRKLRESLVEDRCLRGKGQKRFVLYGLGGAGKTQIGLKFAQDYREDFWGIFWIDATTMETAREGFINVARACKQEEELDSIKAWLSASPDWLLIIDNADDPSLDITRLFPAGNCGTILLTTRNPDFRQYGSAGSCRVDAMSSDDAVALLFNTAHIENAQRPGAMKPAEEIVKLLGFLALAIIQAGAVIRQQLCTLEGFSEMHNGQKKDLLESGRPAANSDYQHSVFTTWEISVTMIEKMAVENEAALLALELLRLFPFYHFDGIGEKIFRNAREYLPNLEKVVELNCVSQSLVYQAMLPGWNQLKFRKALKVLLDFSLVTVDESRRISMHPLVHEWSRDRMSKAGRGVSWDLAILTLAMSMPMSNSYEDHQCRRHLLPHINACLGSIEGHERLFTEGPRLREHLFVSDRFAFAYGEAGRHNVSLELKNAGWKLMQAFMPLENPVIMQTLLDIALYQNCLAKYKESNELFETLAEKARQEYGDTSAEAMQATMGLANSYYGLGNYEVALEVLSTSLIAHEKTYGREHVNTLSVKGYIGGCLIMLERYKEAARVEEEVMESYKKTLPNGHVSVLQCMENLAICYYSMGQAKRSRAMREQAIAAMKETLGENHHITLKAIANSTVTIGLFRGRVAIASKRQVLRKLEENVGELHTTTLYTTTELSRSYFECGMLEKAKWFQEKAVRGMIELHGETHPTTVEAQKYLLRIKGGIDLRRKFYWWVPKQVLERFSGAGTESSRSHTPI